MNFIEKDYVCRENYLKCSPKQFGTLHERMKYVMEVAREETGTSAKLMDALYDLESEVSYTEYANPPYGRRLHTEKSMQEKSALIRGMI